MSPVNKLLYISKLSNFVIDPIEGGKEPCMLFETKVSSTKFVNDPIELGMLPFNKLLLIRNSCRDVIYPIVLCMAPDNLFKNASKYVNFDSDPIEEGNEPPIMLE